MEHANDGLTLWYDTPDAPRVGGTIMIGARPAHPANAVVVRYRTQGQLTRVVPATVLPVARFDGAQYFRARLPDAPPGAVVEFAPVLSCAGRQTPSAREVTAGPSSWCRYRQPPAPSRPADSPRARSCAPISPRFTSELDYLGTVSVTLSPPETIGEVPAGLRRNFFISSGSCVGPRLNATIRPSGADWMIIQRDGVALPNVRTTWETPEGALLYGEYSGTFELGPDGYAGALRNQFPEMPPVQLAPRFVTSHPRYLWLNRLQCVGIGRVDMTRLIVEYDLHAVKAASRRSG
jgi:Protein of unknown function (DUF3237)